MATLDIEGQHVNVDDSFLKLSPEQQDATVSEIASSLKAKPSEGSSLSGIAKSAGVGLAQGALGIAGIPGDLADLNMKLAGRNATSGLGSADLQKKVEQYTGDFYKPQGTAEDIASKIGQFAPAAIGGPGSMAARLATRVAAPALASEAGGAVAGPYGELAGALAGGVGATAAARKFQEMAAARNGPETIKSPASNIEDNIFPAVNHGESTQAAANTKGMSLDDFMDHHTDAQAQQGFVTSFGRFVNRDEALKIANKENQVRPESPDTKWWNGGKPGLLLPGGLSSEIMQNPVGRAAPALTAEKVLETASKQFNDARDMNVVVKPDFATSAAADMRSAIKGYDPNLVRDIHAAADRVEALGSSPKPSIGPAQRLQAEMNWEPLPVAKAAPPVAMNDMEFIRKELVSLKSSPDGSIRSAAKDAIKSLQQSQMGLTAADTLSGDAGAYRNLVSEAVGNWAKGKQAQTVLGKIGNAELNSATAGSGANQDNNMRQAMKQLARNANNTNLPIWKKLGFSDQAGAAIDQAARGTTFGNVMRGIGKGAPTGVVSAAGGLGIGHMAGGPVGAVALPAAGYIAKKIGDLSTKRAANAITSLVLSESPLAAHVASQLPSQIIQQMPARAQRLLQAMILADPSLSQAAQQQRDPVGQSNTY